MAFRGQRQDIPTFLGGNTQSSLKSLFYVAISGMQKRGGEVMKGVAENARFRPAAKKDRLHFHEYLFWTIEQRRRSQRDYTVSYTLLYVLVLGSTFPRTKKGSKRGVEKECSKVKIHI